MTKNTNTTTVLHYPVTRIALAKIYRISAQTFKNWLQDIGITHNNTLSPANLKAIIRHYELPDDVEIKIR